MPKLDKILLQRTTSRYASKQCDVFYNQDNQNWYIELTLPEKTYFVIDDRIIKPKKKINSVSLDIETIKDYIATGNKYKQPLQITTNMGTYDFVINYHERENDSIDNKMYIADVFFKNEKIGIGYIQYNSMLHILSDFESI